MNNLKKLVIKVEEEMTDEEWEKSLEEFRNAPLVNDEKKVTRSRKVQDTWNDDDIAKRRTTRNHVVVSVDDFTSEFKSVAAAFDALGLPQHKHSRFRTKLKKEEELIFIWENKNYLFKIVERK